MKNCIKKYLLCLSSSIFIFFYYFPNDYVIIIGSFLFFIILTINFPIIAYYMQMQPTYYEDLNLENQSKVSFYSYQNIFIYIQQFFSSLAFAILIDYIFNKMKHTTLSWLELYGVLAGYFLMYQKLSNYIGTILVNLIFTIKNSNNKDEDEDDDDDDDNDNDDDNDDEVNKLPDLEDFKLNEIVTT